MNFIYLYKFCLTYFKKIIKKVTSCEWGSSSVVEHLLCTQRVGGSIPFFSTILRKIPIIVRAVIKFSLHEVWISLLGTASLFAFQLLRYRLYLLTEILLIQCFVIWRELIALQYKLIFFCLSHLLL
jgi:hypothetical protein